MPEAEQEPQESAPERAREVEHPHPERLGDKLQALVLHGMVLLLLLCVPSILVLVMTHRSEADRGAEISDRLMQLRLGELATTRYSLAVMRPYAIVTPKGDWHRAYNLLKKWALRQPNGEAQQHFVVDAGEMLATMGGKLLEQQDDYWIDVALYEARVHVDYGVDLKQLSRDRIHYDAKTHRLVITLPTPHALGTPQIEWGPQKSRRVDQKSNRDKLGEGRFTELDAEAYKGFQESAPKWLAEMQVDEMARRQLREFFERTVPEMLADPTLQLELRFDDEVEGK